MDWYFSLTAFIKSNGNLFAHVHVQMEEMLEFVVGFVNNLPTIDECLGSTIFVLSQVVVLYN